MTDETYQFVCPCCEELLSLDLEGEVTAVVKPELKPTQRRGIGGLVTESNPNDKFYSHGYQDNQPIKPTMKPLGTRPVPTPAPVVPDEGLMEANRNDLKERNIK